MYLEFLITDVKIESLCFVAVFKYNVETPKRLLIGYFVFFIHVCYLRLN